MGKTIFIGGYLRSGTTMLQQLLCASPQTNNILGEAIPVRGVVDNFLRCRNFYDLHTKDYFDTPEAMRDFFRDQLQTLLALMAEKAGKPEILVLKHPQLTPHFPLLFELNPELRFAVIVRDPRDIVASAMRAKRKGSSEFAGVDAVQVAQAIMAFYLPVLAAPPKSPFRQACTIMQYEALAQHCAADLDNAMQRLSDHTGIPLSAKDVRSHYADSSQQEQVRAMFSDPLYTEQYKTLPNPDSIGRYRETLQPADIQTVQQICGKLMAAFKYQ